MGHLDEFRHALWFENVFLDSVGILKILIITRFWAGVAQLARASAFQAEGRGFESRFPLQFV